MESALTKYFFQFGARVGTGKIPTKKRLVASEQRVSSPEPIVSLTN